MAKVPQGLSRSTNVHFREAKCNFTIKYMPKLTIVELNHQVPEVLLLQQN